MHCPTNFIGSFVIITSYLYLIVSLKVNEADIRKLIMREIVCKGNIKLCNHSILWPFDWLEVIQLSCIKFSEFAKALLNSYIPPKRSDRINWKIEIKVFKSSWKSQSPTKTKVVVLPPSCFALRPIKETEAQDLGLRLLRLRVVFRAEKRSAQASAHPLSQAQGGLFCVLTVFVCYWSSEWNARGANVCSL